MKKSKKFTFAKIFTLTLLLAGMAVGIFVVQTDMGMAGILQLDPIFNTLGYVTHDGAAGGSGTDDFDYSLQIQSDGKYVLSGWSVNAVGDRDMAIWRYNSDGTLDTTFNSVGYVTHGGAAGGIGSDYATFLQIQSDGKYVASGYSMSVTGGIDMAIWRYNSDGTLDATFNSVGYVTHNGAAGGNGHDIGTSLQIRSDGKYVVSGYSKNAVGQADMAIWRYNSDGTLDTTFNSVGYVTHGGASGGTAYNIGYSLQIQSDGKYVVGGCSSSVGGDRDMAIWRYNSDGTLDTTFNSVGYITHDSAAGGSSWDDSYFLQIQSDGKYVASGYSTNVTGGTAGRDMAIWRYNSDGTLDTTFNSVGYVTHDGAAGGSGSDESRFLQIQSDGKYVLGGWSTNAAGNKDMTIWRYNSDGTLDTTFNNVGYVIHDGAAGGNGDDEVWSLQIQSDGKYVAGGCSVNAAGDKDMAIWRYFEEGTVQFTLTDSSGAESVTSMQLELTLSAISGKDVTVDYAVTGGTATGGGTDYTLVTGTATIPAGSLTTTIDAVIVDDSTSESDETIIVTISGPANATLGTNTAHTYTIPDDDASDPFILYDPIITSDGGGQGVNISINENETFVTTVGADVLTGTLEYGIYDGYDKSFFTIDSETGELNFINAPDYENPQDKNSDNEYDVLVKVINSEHPQPFDLQSVRVIVLNVDEEIVDDLTNLPPSEETPAEEIVDEGIHEALKEEIREQELEEGAVEEESKAEEIAEAKSRAEKIAEAKSRTEKIAKAEVREKLSAPCGPYLLEYIKFGSSNNNPEAIKKLKEFLNQYEGENLDVNNTAYDQSSLRAVTRFQEKYSADILASWGLSKGTGYVYRTTVKKINELYCQEADA